MIIRWIVLVLIGFSSGVVIAGGIFAFISVIGVVPRMAQKTNTEKFIRLYEDAIFLGGVFGATTFIMPIRLQLGIIGLIIIGFCVGIFIGCIAVSVAEVIDVVPILTRRIRLKRGLAFFMLSLAMGKLIGALLYFLIPGFIKP